MSTISPDLHAFGTPGDFMVSVLESYADRVAFEYEGAEISYAETARHVGQSITLLRELGLRKGDTIVQLSSNRPHVFYLMVASYLLGLRSVTLHALGSLDEHLWIARDAGATIVLFEHAHAARAEALKSKMPEVGHWFSHDETPEAPNFWSRAEASAPAPLVDETTPDDVIRLAYTGGTTGKPKGVMLTGRTMMMQCLMLLSGLPIPEGLRLICPAPISHGAGALMMPVLSRGGTVLLQSSFDVDTFLDAVEAGGDGTFLVPTMIYRILEHPRTATVDFSRFQMMLYGAAPMSPARLEDALQAFGSVMVQVYGQTESPAAILTLSRIDHMLGGDVLASAGRPFPGIRVRLLDDNGNEVPRGELGELCVRGPLVMAGYLNNAAETASALEGGWLHTGDIARQDARGFYHLVDRKRDMIVTGGFNVYPREIEDSISTHPGVSLVAVIGVPDAKWGEAVKALIVPRKGQIIDPEDIKARVKRDRGATSVPKSVEFLTEFPLTSLGKIDKKSLRQRFWGDQNRNV